MVEVIFDNHFTKIISKIKDIEIQKSIKDKIGKIIETPEIGKPIRNVRKSTREIYSGSFRLPYIYYKNKKVIEFLRFYHKDKQ